MGTIIRLTELDMGNCKNTKLLRRSKSQNHDLFNWHLNLPIWGDDSSYETEN